MKMRRKLFFNVFRIDDEDRCAAGRELTQEEISLVSRGIKKLGDAPIENGEGGTWVPAGSIKVILAGVQIN
jgi:hypothetical protein